MRIPHTQPACAPEPRPGRLASSFRDDPDGCALAVVGLPDDTGVGLNLGRRGAAAGPAAIRASLGAFGRAHDAVLGRALGPGIYDAGDVAPAEGDDAAAVLETHDRVTVALEAIHGLGLVPICLGGGHDLTRASVRGLARSAGGALGGINMDAHLDVREAVGSGMPFRRLIEDGELDGRRFVELGIGRHACDAEHLAYLAERGARVIGVERALSDPDGAVDEAFGVALAGGGPAFVSIDLDGIDGSRAPGVSSPSPMGLETPTAAAIALRAGREPGVGHFDVMELNPTYDLDGRTARVAALLVLQFVSGFAERAS